MELMKYIDRNEQVMSFGVWEKMKDKGVWSAFKICQEIDSATMECRGRGLVSFHPFQALSTT